MAFITLQGTLLDPDGSFAIGDEIRFTHKSTTGSTLKSAVTLLKITTKGNYYIDLQYGLVLVEYKDKQNTRFENLGVATVNATNPATSIPELLSALVPVSSAELIAFQAILADTVAAKDAAVVAKDEAEAAAASVELLNDNLSLPYVFDTVAEFKVSLIVFPVGKRIQWQGYYAESDGGSNWGIVKSGAHIDDGGSIFTLADGKYVESNLKGSSINALKFGVKVNDNTFDSLATLNNLNAYAKGAATNERRTIKLPSGGLAISNTFTLIRELIYQGMGAKVSIFYPFSGWDNTNPKFLLEDELLDLPNNTPDNNFFGIRRDFGTRNDQAVSNIGCLWARPGGGSEYTNLYLADAYLEDTLLVSGDGGGASVAASFNNIWLATTGANPGTGTSNSRAKNGLSCNNCFSITFKNIIVDYQTNDTDYVDPTNDTDGFGVKLVNSQVVFINPNMEGNAKPFYVSSAQHSVIYGGSIYRQGLGAQTPNTDPDFIFRAASENSMPSILNVFASLGYGESNGGGVAAIIGFNNPLLINTSADLATVNGGGFSYFNANSLNIRSLDSVDIISTPLELEVNNGAIFQSPISRLYRSVNRNEHSQIYGTGTGNVVIPLAGYGRLMITATRNDSSNSNRGQVIDALYAGELVADGAVSVTNQIDQGNGAFDVITLLSIVDDGSGGSALNVAYNAPSFPFLLNVIFEGRTKKNVER